MLILLAHGSPKAEWRDSVERLAAVVGERSGPDTVCLAYMDHGPPTLMEAAAAAVNAGATHLRVLPLFLTGEGHVTHDIVPMVDGLKASHQNIEVELLPAIGQHPMFRKLLENIALREDG